MNRKESLFLLLLGIVLFAIFLIYILNKKDTESAQGINQA